MGWTTLPAAAEADTHRLHRHPHAPLFPSPSLIPATEYESRTPVRATGRGGGGVGYSGDDDGQGGAGWVKWR